MNREILIAPAVIALAAGFAIPAAAQDGPVKPDVMVWTAQAPPPPPLDGARVSTFEFVSAEAGIAGRVVKGAPYSATTVTETVQTLADGNRITNTVSSSVARDSEGRTRREHSLKAIGPWPVEGDAPKMVTINDPVAGVTYLLDERTKTARKLPVRTIHDVPGGEKGPAIAMERQVPPGTAVAGVAAAGGHVVMMRHAEPGIQLDAAGQPKVEQLGTRDIEGVIAGGTRTTLTIAAGAVGNERPIEIVDERWYSTELQTTVMSKHSDPRMGETTFRLTKLSRAEPASSLFEVPADYKVVEDENLRMKVEKDGKVEKE
jgi:hypothetical protein